jgi:hypothetical protein
MASGQFRSSSPRALTRDLLSGYPSVSSSGSHRESILDCVCFTFFREGRVWWPQCVCIVY